MDALMRTKRCLWSGCALRRQNDASMLVHACSQLESEDVDTLVIYTMTKPNLLYTINEAAIDHQHVVAMKACCT